MGEWLAGLRMHRRAVALGAVVLLPLSTAAATTSVAGARAPLAPIAGAGPQAGLVLGIPAAPVPLSTVDKTLPIGWTGPGGHTPVVVGTTRQRVVQVSATTSHDIPLAALDAYRNAQASLAVSDPGCHLSWTLLAGIGQVESDNGRYGGAVVLANGDISPHILGPVLNGTGGVGAIRDTDNGSYDGDPVWDRAVGPMQFIPGTWAGYGADGNADGVRDPNNIADAALGAGHYLCSGGGDLRVEADLRAAVMRYNHSVAYVDLVLRLAEAYAHGAATVIPNGRPAPPAPPAHDGPGAGEQSGRTPQQPRHEGGGKDPAGGRHGGSGGGPGAGGNGGSRGGGHGGGHGGRHPVPPPIHTDPHQKPPTVSSPVKPTLAHQGPGWPKPPHPTPVPTPPAPTSPPPSHPWQTKPPPTKPPHSKPPLPAPPEVVVTGELRPCKTAWCVGTTVLDFGVDADLTQRLGDLDGDGKTSSLVRELKAMRGLTVTVELVPEPAEISARHRANDQAREAPGTAVVPAPPTAAVAPAAPTDPKGGQDTTGDPAPVIVTVNADGLVTSINGVAYPMADATPVSPTPAR